LKIEGALKRKKDGIDGKTVRIHGIDLHVLS